MAVAEWMPLVIEALQHAGGDGLDIHLHQLFLAPGREAKQAQCPLFADLRKCVFEALAADSFERLDACLKELRGLLSEALQPDALWPLSERKLKYYGAGTLELDQVLILFFSSARELALRIQRFELGLEHLTIATRQCGGSLAGATQRLKQLRTLAHAEMRGRGYAPRQTSVPLFDNPPTNLSRELRAVVR